MKTDNYKRLSLILFVSFVVMYAVMFLNVSQPDHIYLSITRFYMTLLMVLSMAVLMLLFMPKMYSNRQLNITIGLVSVILFVVTLFLLRKQTFIKDRQYMKAMISHHSSAILTSEHATIEDLEVRKLADKIIESQKKEIEQMKEMLEKMENKHQ